MKSNRAAELGINSNKTIYGLRRKCRENMLYRESIEKKRNPTCGMISRKNKLFDWLTKDGVFR